MFDTLWSGLDHALGLSADELTAWQMVLRAALIYPVGIAFVRLGDKRFVGKFTAFDVIMGILIGSILSRTVTGNSPFFGTMAASLALVLLHYAFASASFHWDGFGNLVKGVSRTLVVDGSIQWDAMRKSNISEKDLLSAVRENAGMQGLQKVRLATLERSGNISVVADGS